MGTYETRTWDSLQVGEKASFTKTISEQDDKTFAEISGDLNPAHVDEEYAKGTMFKTRIVHGAFTNSLISAVVGMKLPGVGCIYANQESRFTAPVHFGSKLTAHAEVAEKYTKKDGKLKFVKIKTWVVIDEDPFDPNQNGKTAVDGMATIMMLK